MFGNGAIVVFMIIFPNFISPLFNKFTSLGEEFSPFDAEKLRKEGKSEDEIKGKFIFNDPAEAEKKHKELIVKEKDLRSRVQKISKKINFPMSEILKCDGSTRSHHSNAYFFGIFKKKRIVIFDTLIE